VTFIGATLAVTKLRSRGTLNGLRERMHGYSSWEISLKTTRKGALVLVNLFGPHTSRIVGMLTGNHEERSFKDNGIDPSKYMARVLGVPYLRYAGFLRTVVGGYTYITYATHGGSGSATVAGKLNAVKKLSGVAQADVYLMGHMHDLIESTSTVRTVDSRNRTVRDARQHFVVTGSFLGYEDSYSEMKNYSPPKLGAPRVRYSGEEKAVHVSI